MLIGWCSWSQRAARVSPRANVEVTPHAGRIGYHPRITNASISLQIQQPRDENGDLPGGYRPARCGKPSPTGWLPIGRSSWSQHAARVASMANAEVPPHPGKIISHPRIRNSSVSLQLQQPGDENGDLPGRYRPAWLWKPQPHWLIADWLGLMEPARGESCPSNKRRGLAALGEDWISSPDQKSFHISTIPTTRGRKQRSPGSILPRTVWKPQPH